MTTTAPRTTLMMITPALVRPARCSRSARASARISCSRSALLGFRGGPGGGGTRGPRPRRPLNGRHFGPPLDQFHDKLSRLYGSFGSSIGTSRVNACLAPSMRQSDTSSARRPGRSDHASLLGPPCCQPPDVVLAPRGSDAAAGLVRIAYSSPPMLLRPRRPG